MRHLSPSWFVAAAAIAALSAPAKADEVLVWNDLLLDTYRSMGGCPCPLARIGAMMSAAVFDAVNSIDGGYEPYLVSIPASSAASKEAAAAQAAHDVLLALFPAMQAEYDAQLIASLGQIADGPEKSEGVAIGAAVAAQQLASRVGDGWDLVEVYVPGTGVGDWRPTWPDFLPPCTSHWGAVTPFGLQSGDQFRPADPPTVNSPEYLQDYMEVKEYGRLVSNVRNSDQYTIAWFWANDRDGTYKPPGQLAHITDVVSRQFDLSLVENARLFALVNLAMGDAAIAAWDSKYDTAFDLWRPITGIRLGASDGNPDTPGESNWVPLNTGSPPFPAYVSGHATFGAAHAAVMSRYFGTDDVSFTCSTDDPKLEPGITTRSFTSFSQAALENGRSRVYLGVHWQVDADAGYAVGTQVGNWTFDHYLRPVTTAVGSELAQANSFTIQSIWPNPTRGGTSLRLVLPESGHLETSVFDAGGRRVQQVPAAQTGAGEITLSWDGREAGRNRVPAGVYFVRGSLSGTSAISHTQARLIVLP
ncbi:MAG: phosphatase PAP2 family protein [Candidatus Eisenbacteria bacterium]|nr:phosphatase PAP2 family protein [Candidatus Eisenbacteria bacterium]